MPSSPEKIMTTPSPGPCPPLPEDFPALLQRIAEIGAPTGQEGARADYLVAWFNALRPGIAERDDIHNVVVDLSDGASGIWLFDAHTDIVFDDTTLSVVKDDPIWRCPGITDDTISVVALQMLARHFIQLGGTWPLIFSFTVGEEGEGDLRGIRAVGARLQKRLRGAWCIDYILDAVTTAAVGSKRYRMAWQAKGGHSWGNFGEANAIHAQSEWITSLAGLAEWKHFFLSYNIGRISGGTTVNSLAEQAGSVLDLRSVEPGALDEANRRVLAKADEVAKSHGVEVVAHPIGDRPAGVLPTEPPILDWMQEIQAEMGLPFRGVVNSTNANALLALGIPATTTGIAHGGAGHTREEWLDLDSLKIGWPKLWKMTERVL